VEVLPILRLGTTVKMSRICVKNLPPYATEEKLKAFFGGSEAITDVKIARTK
jgi:RNA recognition motif-containing protein